MNAESVSASLFDHRESASHGLVDALELCLLLRDDGRRFDRAIVRWQARYATETAGETVEEAQAVLALLAALRGGEGSPRLARRPNSSIDAGLSGRTRF